MAKKFDCVVPCYDSQSSVNLPNDIWPKERLDSQPLWHNIEAFAVSFSKVSCHFLSQNEVDWI
jgi:hypothetical protein